MTEILNQAGNEQRRQLDLADDGIAAATEQSANHARFMVVIHYKVSRIRGAEQTSTTLQFPHRIDLGWRQAVLLHEPSAEILLLGSAWIGPAPFAQSLIAALSIGLTVLAIACARALATDAAMATPFGEHADVKITGASGTGNCHASSVARSRGNARRHADQPCHADVLLELANPVSLSVNT